MGQTSENVGREFNITREMQDHYAVESYRRAEVAQKNGWFDDEIVPITVKLKNKDGNETDATLTRDEIRWNTTYEKISKLPPSFPDHGDKSHAGNSSQVTDGAAAIILMKRSKALELRQPILGKYVGTAIAGLEPRIMVREINRNPISDICSIFGIGVTTNCRFYRSGNRSGLRHSKTTQQPQPLAQ